MRSSWFLKCTARQWLSILCLRARRVVCNYDYLFSPCKSISISHIEKLFSQHCGALTVHTGWAHVKYFNFSNLILGIWEGEKRNLQHNRCFGEKSCIVICRCVEIGIIFFEGRKKKSSPRKSLLRFYSQNVRASINHTLEKLLLSGKPGDNLIRNWSLNARISENWFFFIHQQLPREPEFVSSNRTGLRVTQVNLWLRLYWNLLRVGCSLLGRCFAGIMSPHDAPKVQSISTRSTFTALKRPLSCDSQVLDE